MISRRHFLSLLGVSAAAGASLPLFHFSLNTAGSVLSGNGSRTTPKLNNWEDLYRQRWTWDKVAKGTHAWANCRSGCAWDLYVKDGIVVREEQTAEYEASESGVPDFNPRGCQKGGCYTEVMYGPSRTTVPLKRVGERGSGKWERISWGQAADEIGAKMLDIAEKYGPDAINQQVGPNFDQGATSTSQMRFINQIGGLFVDSWAELGDLNFGGVMTMGHPHTGGSADGWFLSDFIVVWMMNPAVCQMPDAHFLYEAKYNGSELVVIDPQYSATAIHADQWLPIETGADAALGLATARHIFDIDALDHQYVREQTDLPLLIRLDTGRFLRGEDMEQDGAENMLYVWDEKTDQLTVAPGCQGGDSYKLDMDELYPYIEGTFEVTLKDGQAVVVSPVGSVLREHLNPWTFEQAAKITTLSVAQIKKFADGFAKSKRPMVLSGWGSNRFLHSDLMNRAKLLCLVLKGAIGKKGAGYEATGWIGLDGVGDFVALDKDSTSGRVAMMTNAMSHVDMWDLAFDLLLERKNETEMRDTIATAAEHNMFCYSDTPTLNYRTAPSIAKQQNKDISGEYPQELDEYLEESQQKGWLPEPSPVKGPPRAYFGGGSNILRRSNMTQQMLDEWWPNLELVVDINPKYCFTGLHADYILPAAGWYEKPGIKYPVAHIPYLHYCDAAVPPLAESKDEWEIYSLILARAQYHARQRNTPTFKACNRIERDWKTVYDRFSFEHKYGPKDCEKVNELIINNSKSSVGEVSINELKEKGISKFVGTGSPGALNQIENPDWNGEGVLTPFTRHTEHKERWPTYSGRLTTYIDHPWFIEAREAFTTHKMPGKAGGDHPFQLVSCHSRWSIHSMWRDTPLLLRMQRGEPVVLMNKQEALAKGVQDHAWIEMFNDIDTIKMRVKHSTMIRPGVLFYFHAWEPTQFPDHKSYKFLTTGMMKPLHAAGGYGHIKQQSNHFMTGNAVQDTRVDIRPINSPESPAYS
jgi:DMSO reductase family type II enzyme molybdopterin subunit